MIHPGRYIGNKLKENGRTQKQFADILSKKVSEINELINGKRNITIQWDLVLAIVFDDPEGKWIKIQNDYDFYLAKLKFDKNKSNEIIKKKNQIKKHETFSKF